MASKMLELAVGVERDAKRWTDKIVDVPKHVVKFCVVGQHYDESEKHFRRNLHRR